MIGGVKKRSFAINVCTTGEIDAWRSTTIASSLHGDMSKLIELIADGSPVNKGDIIAKIDPTPFEERVNDIRLKIQDQTLKILALEQALEREKQQVSYEKECIEFEIESCQLELDRIKNGEGPLEISRLKSQFLKEKSKYEELLAYQGDLEQLVKRKNLPPGELIQCQKQLEQEKEAYCVAEQQYENYVKFVYPSSIKKADVNLKKAIAKKRETENVGEYRIASAAIVLDQANKQLEMLQKQSHNSENELFNTIISSPSTGIVVHRAEFRGGQKRKPQMGDMLMKNQPLIEIPDLSLMIVRTKLREMDLHKVDVGKPASVEVDAFPGKIFSGEVTYLGTLAQLDNTGASKEKAFEMLVQLTDKDTRLRPGMTARVIIHSKIIDQELSIPAHAVFYSNNKYFCYVLNSKGYSKKEIEVTPANDQWVLVSRGLSEGDEVLLSPPAD